MGKIGLCPHAAEPRSGYLGKGRRRFYGASSGSRQRFRSDGKSADSIQSRRQCGQRRRNDATDARRRRRPRNRCPPVDCRRRRHETRFKRRPFVFRLRKNRFIEAVMRTPLQNCGTALPPAENGCRERRLRAYTNCRQRFSRQQHRRKREAETYSSAQS